MTLITAQPKTSSGKISEALELLNEAAKEKKDELKGLMTDRYSHIKGVMTEKAEHGKEILKEAQELASHAILESEEKVKKVAVDVDKRVHSDPWPYLAGAAAVSLLVGYVMGSKRK